MKLRPNFEIFVRYADAGNLLEAFFVSAVSSLLLIRTFLELAGYPTFGGGRFHIAHMLWGGLLMMLAILLALVFLNKEAKQVAAVAGGIGFGMFIDELGKFITSNNDYFYQPAIALIYVIFVLFFFAIRAAEKYIPITSRGYAVNAMEAAKEIVLEDLNGDERDRALRYLQQSGLNTKMAEIVRQMLTDFKPASEGGPGLWQQAKQALRSAYRAAVSKRWFTQGIVGLSIIYSVISVLWAIWELFQRVDFAAWGQLIFSMVAAWLAVMAAQMLASGRRLSAYETLKRAVMVSIFLTQFFLYINQQLSATVGLCANLLVFFVLQYLIDQEKLLMQGKDE